METLIVNLSGKTRREQLNGREHIVAPMTLIVPGVLKGSQGSLYYPPDEVASNVDAWNNTPIVVYHPSKNGTAISARNPDVLNSQGIGTVFSAKFDKKLVAEGWFDVESTRKIDERVLNALESNVGMELSTGLNLDKLPADDGAAHNGVPYDKIARNYRPDHLAILPDQTGACSINDGCGTLINTKEQAAEINALVLNQIYKLNLTSKPKDSNMATFTPENRSKIIGNLIDNCPCWNDTDGDKEILNAFDDDKLKALAESLVTSKSNELIANAAKEGFEDKNSTVLWNEKEAKWDIKKKEPKVNLNALHDPEEDAKRAREAGTGDEATANLSGEDWLKQAPEEVRNELAFARQVMDQQKDELVSKLVANADDSFKDDAKKFYGTMNIEQLQNQFKFMPTKEGEVHTVAPNYMGASGPTENAEKFDRSDFLALPEMSFEENKS